MKHTKGFTLIEILIALTILAIVGALMAMGLQTAVRTQSRVMQKAERVAAIQSAIMILERDLQQTINRPIFDTSGELLPAILYTNINNNPTLEFTRAGVINPFAMQNRSTLQRVRYSWDGKNILRITWGALDRVKDTPIYTQQLLSDVTSFTINLINRNNQQPVTVGQQTDQPALPVAIEIKLNVAGIGYIRRLIAIPGVLTP